MRKHSSLSALLLLLSMPVILLSGGCSEFSVKYIPETDESAAVKTAASETKADTASPEEKPLLSIGLDDDFPPFGYEENGEFKGFDIDLAKEAAKRMDYDIKFTPIEWEKKDDYLSDGTINCIWNGFSINGREGEYTWTSPYMDNSQIFVVRTDSGISAASQLVGKAVGVQSGSTALSALNENEELSSTFGTLTEYKQYSAAFHDLESGALDAIAMDICAAKYRIDGKESNFSILSDAIVKVQYAVGFKPGNIELRDKVQHALREMSDDGTFEKISEKWFDYDVGIIGK